jgi:hypothetical protein
MAAHALAPHSIDESADTAQIGLYEREPVPRRVVRSRPAMKVCAGCRAKEARYGFEGEAGEERPHTLCFECFRMEIDRRQRVAAQLARGWNAEQVRLPLADTLQELTRRRRRAQIAARHAICA